MTNYWYLITRCSNQCRRREIPRRNINWKQVDNEPIKVFKIIFLRVPNIIRGRP